ncbi:MAG: TIGR04002 family protein [Clostridia bacterium]|nr:TIGR04002 family protein [Clostridia bacterium]
MRNKKSLLRITNTAIFTAIILLATSVIKFSTGLGEGYIHLGDSFVYLAACVLPFPYCIIAGALGGALADILSGYAIWAVPTMIIKVLNVIPFALVCRKYKSNKILSKQTVLMTVVSGVITIFGYFVAESILYSVASATLSLIGNTIQAVASGIIFLIIAKAVDKINLKSKISKGV